MATLSKSQSVLMFMILFIACTPKDNVESQTLQPPSSSVRKMPGGNCEDCNLMFVGMPKDLNNVDTSRGWDTEGQKLIVSGKVFHTDKKTPAKDVILYYYHTDEKGYYSEGEGMHPDAARHGHLRGWVKTGDDGTYVICTNRPAQYPDNGAEAHIHVIVKEPDMDNPYWIDAWVFDDDPLLTASIRKKLDNHGGSGIMKPISKNGIQLAEQNVYLGLHIPNYPTR